MHQNRTRRTVLILAGVGIAFWGGRSMLQRKPPFEFEPVPGLPGFRRLPTGQVSRAAIDPFIGLDAPRPPPPDLPDDRVCSALFRGGTRGAVPVASFSDYYCPYCRVLTQELAMREDAGEIAVTWHELPLLGEASDLAARAALAADLQGAYPAFHARLMRSRVVAGDAYLRDLAEGAGLDTARLVRDAGGGLVAGRIETARALAARFGFYGTPALVIGRTAVLGAITPERLDALVALEAEGDSACRT